jgi:hypothetical protein
MTIPGPERGSQPEFVAANNRLTPHRAAPILPGELFAPHKSGKLTLLISLSAMLTVRAQ